MTASRFLKIRCRDCSEERVVFERSSTTVTCDVCGATLVVPAGGKAKILADIIEVLE